MLLKLIIAGLVALKEYVAYHVLTCLIPAFLLAGAMVSFVSKEAIIGYLGYTAKRIRAFFVSALGSFFIAACSCTVIPVASGLYYRGAGVGPAFILLWVAPAANILALVYTGAVIGYDMALTRLISALLMAFVVGSVMSFLFRKTEEKRVLEVNNPQKRIMEKKDIVILILLVITLLAPNYLIQSGPYLNKIYIWLTGMLITFVYVFFAKNKTEIKNWLTETWWFVKIIFPLLLLGVFVVGVVGEILPQKVIQNYLGGNGVLACFLATITGQLAYFATMTEAPFVHTLMKLGMGKGPALALLLTGPGMSLPNMLAIIKVFGWRKAVVYILLIMSLGTFVGWFTGNLIF